VGAGPSAANAELIVTTAIKMDLSFTILSPFFGAAHVRTPMLQGTR
jgi:hypothetical protein